MKLPHGKLIKRPITVLYPLEINETKNQRSQSSTIEEPIQKTKQEKDHTVLRTRSAAQSRISTQPEEGSKGLGDICRYIRE